MYHQIVRNNSKTNALESARTFKTISKLDFEDLTVVLLAKVNQSTITSDQGIRTFKHLVRFSVDTVSIYPRYLNSVLET